MKAASLMGKLANGSARDAGKLVHIVGDDIGQYGPTGRALCGAKPGRSSGGWDVQSHRFGMADVTCARCLAKHQPAKHDESL